MAHILVINAGSSSIKYQLINVSEGRRSASGLVERIGADASPGRITHRTDTTCADPKLIERDLSVPDHAAGFAAILAAIAECGAVIEELDVRAVGHRIVQGGSEFIEPTLIDETVAARILQLGSLAPLHNPGQYQAILAAQLVFPEVPHVAVFDTAFHQSMPPRSYTYAIDRDAASAHGIRRYGFHGISHQVVSRRAAEFLNRPIEESKQVVLHLGNGASACAILGGRSVDTSMGFTPLEGLMMGTRGGDLDPGVLLHLLRAGLGVDELDDLLNRRSGLAGLSSSNDFRDVWGAASEGNADARLALDVYVHRIRHYIGAYLAVLGGADALIFTAGVGENHAAVRAEICAGLEWLGIELDTHRNRIATGHETAQLISTDSSRVAVLVVPTDEEAEIARQTAQLVGL